MVHPKKILLLEDHVESRRLMSGWLKRHGYEVVETGTVAEAIANLDGQAMALLDLNLPDGLGTEVLAHIRRQNHLTHVAFVTATHDIDAVKPMLCSVDTIFRKPIDLQKLMAWIAAHGGDLPPLDPKPQ